jgi:hypothetical protein
MRCGKCAGSQDRKLRCSLRPYFRSSIFRSIRSKTPHTVMPRLDLGISSRRLRREAGAFLKSAIRHLANGVGMVTCRREMPRSSLGMTERGIGNRK